MKKTVNTFVLAGIMSAGFSCMALAESPTGAQGLDAGVDVTLQASNKHNKQLDELVRAKELLELEGTLSKLRLDKEKSDSDMMKLKGFPAAAATAPSERAPDSALGGMPDMNAYFGPSAQSQPADQKKASDSPLDRVYVTRVYGVGGVRNVTVYYDNGIFTGTVGDEIVDGLKISSVSDNGAVFSYKGKTKRVNLTTQSQAYTRSQVKQKPSSSPDASPPTNNGQAFGRLAQEIGATTVIPPPHPR